MGVQYIISWGSYAVAMNKKEIKTKPPYPSLGEIIQLLATAFGTKSANAEIRKKLDRLAREGDFDWSLPSQTVDELLLKPLDEFDPDYSEFVGDFVNFITVPDSFHKSESMIGVRGILGCVRASM
jgi:hypothetical protein